MNIYVAHSSKLNFKEELYKPIIESSLAKDHNFAFPHKDSSKPFDSKQFLENECDLVVAEVSRDSTGLGIELGWANLLGIPVVCFYKNGKKISNSLTFVFNNVIEYSSNKDLITKLKKSISKIS